MTKKQLIAGAKPYCVWTRSIITPEWVGTRCDMDAHYRFEEAEKLEICPACERPIRKEWHADAGGKQ